MSGTSGTVLVPAIIDQTGTTDVTVGLQTALTAMKGKAGLEATLQFQPGAAYLCQKELDIPDYVVIDLNGGTLLRTTATSFGLEPSVDITNDRFNYAGHGLDGTKPFTIVSGILWTAGVANGGIYWPVSILANSFQVSATQGGSPIALTAGSVSQQIRTTVGSTSIQIIGPGTFTQAMVGATISGGHLPGGETIAGRTSSFIARLSAPATVAETFTASISKAGAADTKVQVTNAPTGAGNPTGLRAFPWSSNFPGNDNYDNPQIRYDGPGLIRVIDSAGGGSIQGAQTNGIIGSYDPRYEGSSGVFIAGSNGSEVAVAIGETLGDGIQVLTSTLFGAPKFWHLHHNVITGPGRHGISVGNGGATDGTIEDNQIIGAPRHEIDLESDNVGKVSTIRRIVKRRNYFRLGNNPASGNINGWIAMGGESSDMGDIVVGGLLGHPEDGNLVVGGVMAIDVRNAFTTKPTTRRGPYTFGYNIGGGQFTIHTTNGSTSATFSGYTNPTGGTFTIQQIMQFQSIKATGLPVPCQINDVIGTTLTLSHPATATGTVTATFGSEFQGTSPAGPLDFLHIDGANSFFNVLVVQAGRGLVGSLYTTCTAVNDHDNLVFGGADSQQI